MQFNYRPCKTVNEFNLTSVQSNSPATSTWERGSRWIQFQFQWVHAYRKSKSKRILLQQKYRMLYKVLPQIRWRSTCSCLECWWISWMQRENDPMVLLPKCGRLASGTWLRTIQTHGFSLLIKCPINHSLPLQTEYNTKHFEIKEK